MKQKVKERVLEGVQREPSTGSVIFLAHGEQDVRLTSRDDSLDLEQPEERSEGRSVSKTGSRPKSRSRLDSMT